MGCRLVKASDYRMLEENQSTLYDEKIKQVNRRMEQLEKIFEVLTNDSRLKYIIEQIEKIKIILIRMFHYNNRKPNQPLVKIKTSYDKIEKQLNEPARDYNTIKELVENQENSITNIKNKNIINKDIPILPKQKNKNKNRK